MRHIRWSRSVLELLVSRHDKMQARTIEDESALSDLHEASLRNSSRALYPCRVGSAAHAATARG